MSEPYGYELIADYHGCNPTAFTEDQVQGFCRNLAAAVDMEVEDFHIWASDPADIDTDPDHLHGVSAVQFITTSTIVVHTLTKLGKVYLNLFSCKKFDPEIAVRVALEWFGGYVKGYRFIERM